MVSLKVKFCSQLKLNPALRAFSFGSAVSAAFICWWIVAEALTPDGVNVRWDWDWRQWIAFGVGLLVPGLLAGWRAPDLRKWWFKHVKPDGGTLSLKWLVGLGLFATVVVAASLIYWQAELLTLDGESVSSVESAELLDITRSTAFSLGAIGAIAALLVGYRRQKSIEDAHQQELDKHSHEVQKHADEVDAAQKNLALERDKQRAEQISKLHDRYAKAVEQLADDKVTIRLGGVYVLAALAEDWRARDNYRQHQVCVDMLCSYLRSAEYKVVDSESDEASDQLDWDKLKKDQPVRKAALECLSEIKRREVEGPEGVWAKGVGELKKLAYGSLGISTAPLRMDLQGIPLVGLELRHARLAYLHLESAKLMSADLTGADLTSAKLNHAAMNGATLAGTNLTRTDLSDASIINCSLKGAYIIGTKLANATITPPYVGGDGSMDGAILIGVDFAAAFRAVGTGSSVIIDEETLDSARDYMNGGEGQSIRRRPLDADDPDDLARVRNLLAAAGLGEKSDSDLWRAKRLTISLPERDTRPLVEK